MEEIIPQIYLQATFYSKICHTNFLKIKTLWKKWQPNRKKEKLKPGYIRSFGILKRIEDVAYRLVLPQTQPPYIIFFLYPYLGSTYLTRVVSLAPRISIVIRKHTPEKSLFLCLEKIHIFRDCEVPFVPVQQSRHGMTETIWERKDEILAKYSHILN